MHLLASVFANTLIMSCSVSDLSRNSNFQQFTASSAISFRTPRKIHHLKSAPNERNFKLHSFFPPSCYLVSPYQIPVGRKEKEQFPVRIRWGWAVHSHPAPGPPCTPRAVQGLFLSATHSAVAAMPGASSWLESIISLHSVAIISCVKSSYQAPKFCCYEKMLGFT